MKSESIINQYLGKEIHCSCGKKHTCQIKAVEIGKGAMEKIPGFLSAEKKEHIYIISDKNTDQAAGKALCEILDKANISYVSHILKAEEVIPDETTLGEIVMNMPFDTDFIIAVGSGTINDLCKFVSSQKGIEYIVAATAPSMDGFASVGAALISDHLKTTYDAGSTVGVFADTEVLRQAPMNMITAGFGDILGKYTCLLDWKMAYIVNGEYYCDTVAAMVKQSIHNVMATAKTITSRNPEAVENIMEALVLTGIAMVYIGNSRPASGSEHHMSHYWEMKFLMHDKEPVLHGTKVGIGTVASSYLYHNLAKETPDFALAKEKAKSFDKEHWQKEIVRCFELAADGVLALEEKAKKNEAAGQEKRIQAIEENWTSIVEEITTWLPATKELENILLSIGAPINPLEVQVEEEMISDCILYAKEVRDRYTILQLLWDLGLLDSYAQKAKTYFTKEQAAYFKK